MGKVTLAYELEGGNYRDCCHPIYESDQSSYSCKGYGSRRKFHKRSTQNALFQILQIYQKISDRILKTCGLIANDEPRDGKRTNEQRMKAGENDDNRIR